MAVVSASVLQLSKCTGVLGKCGCIIYTLMLVLYYLVCLTDAELVDAGLQEIVMSKANMPLDSSSATNHGSRRKQLSPHHMRNLASAPVLAPNYGTTNGHSPSSSQLSKSSLKNTNLTPPASGFFPSESAAAPQSSSASPKSAMSPLVSNCCGPDTVMLQGSKHCHCVYPVKVDLRLLNVSDSPNWDLFLEEFASGLSLRSGQIQLIKFYWTTLSSLNISLDITPLTGITFEDAIVSAINTSLTYHKVILNSKSVGIGDYKLLNLTWYQPPAPSPAPVVAAPPAKAPVMPVSTSNSSSNPKKGGHNSLIIIISLGALVLMIAVVTVLIICNRSARPGMENLSVEEPEKPSIESARGGSLPHPSSTRFLPYEELVQATNNFEPSSLLGEGGFGKVFKGVLSDGTAVAIKRLTNGGQQGDKEFLVEVEMLSRLHHRNLVKLVGYFSNREASQNLLCYELVPNGSLESWLHGPLGLNCPLDWETRMKIALDAARGLAYLHEDSQPCVIHRDFKASNILLENNFNAKVADFGLAKLAPEGQVNYLSTRVMGTFGYVAPEYAMTGHLLVKSDVYSYGVVLLELLTGRQPVEMSQPSGQENLVTWTRPILRNKERLEDLADPKLQGKYPKEDFVRVCTIASACVSPEANQRPTMGEVVQSLKMVQRANEYQQDSTSMRPPNQRQSSTTFDSDGTSSMFSSGPYSGLSAFDNDNISRTVVFSEDLHEGR